MLYILEKNSTLYSKKLKQKLENEIRANPHFT